MKQTSKFPVFSSPYICNFKTFLPILEHVLWVFSTLKTKFRIWILQFCITFHDWSSHSSVCLFRVKIALPLCREVLHGNTEWSVFACYFSDWHDTTVLFRFYFSLSVHVVCVCIPTLLTFSMACKSVLFPGKLWRIIETFINNYHIGVP